MIFLSRYWLVLRCLMTVTLRFRLATVIVRLLVGICMIV